jgi:hypothetical protein
MSFQTNIEATIHTGMAVSSTALTQSDIASLTTAAACHSFFAKEIENVGGTAAADSFLRITNIREFPAIGAAANLVKVPAYGADQTQQISGQSDATNIELKLNYVPNDWSPASNLGKRVKDNKVYLFRIVLANSEPTGTDAVTKFASTPAGVGTVNNTIFYFVGGFANIQVTPQLTDATQATLALISQSDLIGAYTV